MYYDYFKSLFNIFLVVNPVAFVILFILGVIGLILEVVL